MQKLTIEQQKDIINEHINSNNINISDIGTNVEYCEYYTKGICILLHINNNSSYKTSRGNRMYSILKGSLAKVMDNDVQQILLKEGIIEKLDYDTYKFIKDSEPLSIGKLMRALTVSGSPSVNKNRSPSNCYEITDLITKGKHIVIADKSLETDTLSDIAKKQSIEIAQRVYEDNKRKEQDELEKAAKNLEYYFCANKTYKGCSLEYNKRKFEQALDWVDTYYTLYITGMSRSGKTYITREIAGKYMNVHIDELGYNNNYLESLMWVNTYTEKKEFIDTFARFCLHNKDKDKCLVVFNEADKQGFMQLFPFWEQMDADGKSFKDFVLEGLKFNYNGTDIDIPKGMRIIANIANDQYDIQMENRFGHRLDLDDIIEDDLEEISSYTNIPMDILQILLTFQNINVSEFDNRKRFICIYKLHKDTVNELQNYVNNFRSVKKEHVDMKNKIIEYIESIK